MVQRLNDDAFYKELWRAWRRINEEFRQALVSDLKPSMLLNAKKAASAPSLFQQSTPAKSAAAKLSSRTPATPSKRSNRADVIDLAGSDDESASQYTTPHKKMRNNNSEAVASARSTPIPIRTKNGDGSKKHKFHLSSIQSILDDYCASGLPGGIDRRAIDSMIALSLEHWHEPLLRLVTAVERELLTILENTLDETAAGFKATELYREMHRIAIESFLDCHIKRERKKLLGALELERKKPLTKDRDNLERLKQHETRFLEEARWEFRVKEHFDAQEVKTEKLVSEEVRSRGAKDEKLRIQLGPETFKREIEAIAAVRAYYMIASSRFVDHVCQLVEVDLFPCFGDELHKKLTEFLRIEDDDCKF
jgi:hypothetical protein